MTPNFIVITAVNGTKHAIDISDIRTLTDAIPNNVPEGAGLTMGSDITTIYMRDDSCYIASENIDKLLARINGKPSRRAT